MENVAGDLQHKYQKLATEYSKLRAQASVLKKAVIDEQTRNTEVSNILKEREQSLRKADQEIDSLTFRNQQLAKRVTVLQDELDSMQIRQKKGKGKQQPSGPGADAINHVFDEEFQMKIAENARLISLMHDKDEAHQRELSMLNERIKKLESDLQQRHNVNSDAEDKYRAAIDKLEAQNISLVQESEEQANALEKCTSELATLQEQHASMKHSLSSELQFATTVIENHLPFIDTSNVLLNELNIPSHDRKQQIYALHVIGQAGTYVQDLTSALSDFHTYTEQRLHAIESSLSPINQKFSSHLKENAKYLRSLAQGFRDFHNGIESDGFLSLEELSSLMSLSIHLSSYSKYLRKLQPYVLLSFEKESSEPSCPEKLQLYNLEVLSLLNRKTDLFLKLSTYIHLLSLQNKRVYQHPVSSQKRLLNEVTVTINSLHDTVKDLARAYDLKFGIENDVPTASDKLKTTNECIVKSVNAILGSLSKLCSVLSGSQGDMWKCSRSPTSAKNTHPTVANFRKRAALYINRIEQDEAPSVPYEEALKEREEMRASLRNHESLMEQLDACRNRATKLEKDKEHWRLEYQLLQLRHNKKVKDLEETIQSFANGAKSVEQKSHETEQTILETTTVTNLMGRLDLPFVIVAEMEARENEIKSYFCERINHILVSRQEADTKAATLIAECHMLQQRLETCIASKQVSDIRLEESRDALTKLQEELHTTTHNYETQLSMMSEHLANMNDKLAVQKDEIDQLKFQLENKAGRKGKLKL